jgi:acetolactate synthase-1/3 small subunit
LRHTLAVLVENSPGVLARVAGLFSRRGFNIESLAVGVTADPNISRMTIVVEGDDRTIEQVSKQLNKLINVIKVSDITSDPYVDRELSLIKVNAEPSLRPHIMQIIDVFRAKVVDVGKRSIIVEITGDEGKISAFLDIMREFGIKEVVRTGKIAMVRGTKVVQCEKGDPNHGENLLRSGRELGFAQVKTGGSPRIRKPRSCTSAESER